MGIAVRGQYYPPGKEPKRESGDRKLYIFLEARDETALRRAKEEVVRIMREILHHMVCVCVMVCCGVDLMSTMPHFR